MKKLLAGFALSLSALAGCEIGLEERVREDRNFRVNGIEYHQKDEVLIQKTKQHNPLRFLVLSDTHKNPDKVEYFCSKYKTDIHGIIMLGDYTQFSPDSKEITNDIEPAAKTGLPVYVLTGNHDIEMFGSFLVTDWNLYNKAMRQLRKYENVIDMTRVRAIDGDNFNFFSYPFVPEWHSGDLESYFQRFNDGDATILLSHYPPKCRGKNGTDYEFGFNLGYSKLNSYPYIISGHYHSAFGACDRDGNLIPENTFSGALWFNPGSVWDGRAGIVTIEGKKVKYELLKIEK